MVRGMVVDDQDRVNPTELQARIRRDVALHIAAQTLADADRCRQGLAPVSLRELGAHEAIWYRQTARNLIELFEAKVYASEVSTAAQLQQAQRIAMEAGVQIARTAAGMKASARGHELEAFQPVRVEGSFDEYAVCARCRRIARIEVINTPLRIEYCGAALSEGCLMIAGEPDGSAS